MVNLYDFVSDSSLFKKYKVDDLLFVEYTCFFEDPAGDIWSHNNYFAYVTGGKKMWKTPHSEITVKDGDALFVKKGATTVYQYFEQKFYVLFVFVPDEFIRKVILKHSIHSSTARINPDTHTVVPIVLNDLLNNYFQSLLLYFKQPSAPSKALLQTRLEELILTVLSDRDNEALANYFLDISASEATSVREIMEANFLNNLSLEEFARLSARSLSSFKRDFINLYGIPPGRWLLGKRLDHSRFLLQTTSKAIEDIILESGFTNRSHFMKVFKEKFEITPLQFRNSTHPPKVSITF